MNTITAAKSLRTLGIATALGAIASGCAMVAANIACGEGPEAVKAVESVDDDAMLASIVKKGKNNNARVAAAKKMNDLNRLIDIVQRDDPSTEYFVAAVARVAAMERIDELGATDDCFNRESYSLADNVACEKAMPIALRMKAVNAKVERWNVLSGEKAAKIIADKENPMELRMAAAENTGSFALCDVTISGEKFAVGTSGGQSSGRRGGRGASRFSLTSEVQSSGRGGGRGSGRTAMSGGSTGGGAAGTNGLAAIFNEYLNASGEEREQVGKLIQKCDFHNHLGLIGNSVANPQIALEIRKLLFLGHIENDKNPEVDLVRNDLVQSVFAAGRDVLAGSTDTDNCKIARWAIENTKDNNNLAAVVRIHDSTGEHRDFRRLAVSRITDDNILADFVKKYCKDDGVIAAAAHKAIKDKGVKKSLAPMVAGAEFINICRNGKTCKERAEALEKLYKESPEKAVAMVEHWVSEWDRVKDKVFYKDDSILKPDDILKEVNSFAALCGMLKTTKSIKVFDKGAVQWCLKTRAMELDKKRVDGMDAEKVNKIVNSAIAKAGKLKADGSTFVLDNTWVGMPSTALYAMAKNGKTSGYAYNWDVDETGKKLVVTKIGFSGKGVFNATGIEKSMIVLELPLKLNLSPFEINQTKVYFDDSEKQQLYAFVTGDHASAIKGGKVFWTSETQAKNIKLTYWSEDVILVVENLN